jgi:hypothetical protein
VVFSKIVKRQKLTHPESLPISSLPKHWGEGEGEREAEGGGMCHYAITHLSGTALIQCLKTDLETTTLKVYFCKFINALQMAKEI